MGQGAGVFSYPAFVRLWISDTVKWLGVFTSGLALQLLLIETLAADQVELGLVRSAQWLPMLLFGLLAGVLGAMRLGVTARAEAEKAARAADAAPADGADEVGEFTRATEPSRAPVGTAGAEPTASGTSSRAVAPARSGDQPRMPAQARGSSLS